LCQSSNKSLVGKKIYPDHLIKRSISRAEKQVEEHFLSIGETNPGKRGRARTGGVAPVTEA
jgi:hypothetical protein